MLLVGRQAVGWIEDRISDLFVFKVRKWFKYSFIFASAFTRKAQSKEKENRFLTGSKLTINLLYVVNK